MTLLFETRLYIPGGVELVPSIRENAQSMSSNKKIDRLGIHPTAAARSESSILKIDESRKKRTENRVVTIEEHLRAGRE